MRSHPTLSTAPLLLLALAGCGDQQSAARVEPENIADTMTDNELDHYDAAACTADATGAASLSLEGTTASADGAEIQITDEGITIAEGGTWVVTGTLSGPQLIIDTEDVVRLVLDGVSLQSSEGPALRIEDAEEVTVVLAEGSSNFMRDGATHPEG